MITTTFNYTGAAQQWTVPIGVSIITVELWGACGYKANRGSAGTVAGEGNGAYVKASINVIAGQTYDIYVGGQGTAGAGGFGGMFGGAPGRSTIAANKFSAGGGGGSSEIRRAGTELAIAGGGGGVGGGDSADAVSIPSTPLGGAGGIPATAGTSSPSGGGGGGAATASAGGAAGANAASSGGGELASTAGTASAAGTGGDANIGGSNWHYGGGGGGGGHFGGGGGGRGLNVGAFNGGGGGGGSSMANGGTPLQFLSGVRGSSGEVRISFNEAPPSTPTNITPASGAIINVDDPTLTANFSVSGLQARARVEWTLANDAAFTQNVRTYIQPLNAGQVSLNSLGSYRIGSSTSDQRLSQGTWYIRARTIDANGIASGYSSAHNFRVEHPPSTLNWFPTGNIAVQHVSAGVTLAWDFISSAGVDQIAYQVIVEQNTGTQVLDTGRVSDTDQFTAVIIPAALKGSTLRWRVRVWDSDNVVGPYSPNNLFRTADLPIAAISVMTTVATANPTVIFSATPVNNVPIAQKRLYITRDSDGAIVYDSGWRS